MRPRWWVGVAAGMALGLGAVVAVEAGTGDASAQSGFRASAEQLRINQRISQAAVRRSNEALTLLDPITRQPKIPSKVLGWRTQDLRDGVITSAKIANGSVAEADLDSDLGERLPAWVVVDAGGGVARKSDDRIKVTKGAIGLYTVDFARELGGCAWTGTQVTTIDFGGVGINLDVDTKRLDVATSDDTGALANRPFSLQVTC